MVEIKGITKYEVLRGKSIIFYLKIIVLIVVVKKYKPHAELDLPDDES